MPSSPVHSRKSTIDRLIILRTAMRALSFVAPPIAARLAYRLFITPHRSASPGRELAWSDGAHQRVVDSELGPLATWTWGEGPDTAILLHGWAGRGLQLGGFAVPLVRAGFRVIAFDAPGHGDSAGKTSSLPEIARSLGIIDRHYGGASVVISHSLGATALILGLSRKEIQPRAVVTIAAPARLDFIGVRFGELTGFSESVIHRMREHASRLLSFDWEANEPLRLAPTLETPFLIVHDRDDREIPYQEGSELEAALPNAKMLRTEKLGHRRVLRDDAVIRRVTAFSSTALSPPRRTDEPAVVRRAVEHLLNQPASSQSARRIP